MHVSARVHCKNKNKKLNFNTGISWFYIMILKILTKEDKQLVDVKTWVWSWLVVTEVPAWLSQRKTKSIKWEIRKLCIHSHLTWWNPPHHSLNWPQINMHCKYHSRRMQFKVFVMRGNDACTFTWIINFK